MDNDAAILAELRKISGWIDFQRKVTKWSLIVIPVMIAGSILFSFVLEHDLKTNLSSTDKPDWYDVDRDARTGDFDKAISTGEELIKITPNSPEAHRHLASVYLQAGKIDKAHQEYAEAYRLFPSEENGKLLTAINDRIRSDSQGH